MGWCNYIMVPSLKLAFEISREVDEERCEDLSESLKKCDELEDVWTGDWTMKDIVDKPIKEVMSVVMFHYLLASDIRRNALDKMLYLALKRYDKGTFIVSEFGLDKHEGYKVVVDA